VSGLASFTDRRTKVANVGVLRRVDGVRVAVAPIMAFVTSVRDRTSPRTTSTPPDRSPARSRVALPAPPVRRLEMPPARANDALAHTENADASLDVSTCSLRPFSAEAVSDSRDCIGAPPKIDIDNRFQ
jgi:hypothetical protein